MADPHEVLGVPPEADQATVRSAYRRLLKEHHPDHGGSTERFIRVREAYEALSDGHGRSADGGGLAAQVAGTIRRDADDSRASRVPPADGGSGTSGGSVTGGGSASSGRAATSDGTAASSGAPSGDGTRASPGTATARASSGPDGLELVAFADGLTLRLTAVTDRLPAGALLPDHVEPGRRVAACFLVENVAAEPATWEPRRVRFVDAGGERHHPSVYRPKRRSLPAGWRGDDLEVDPGVRARSFILSRSLPEDVAIEAVVYHQPTEAGPDRRVRFEVDDAVRGALDRDPFE